MIRNWKKGLALLLTSSMLMISTQGIIAGEQAADVRSEAAETVTEAKAAAVPAPAPTPAPKAETKAAPVPTPAPKAETKAAPTPTPTPTPKAEKNEPAAAAPTPAVKEETKEAPAPAQKAESQAAPSETPAQKTESQAAPSETPAQKTESQAAPSEKPAQKTESQTASSDGPETAATGDAAESASENTMEQDQKQSESGVTDETPTTGENAESGSTDETPAAGEDAESDSTDETPAAGEDAESDSTDETPAAEEDAETVSAAEAPAAAAEDGGTESSAEPILAAGEEPETKEMTFSLSSSAEGKTYDGSEITLSDAAPFGDVVITAGEETKTASMDSAGGYPDVSFSDGSVVSISCEAGAPAKNAGETFQAVLSFSVTNGEKTAWTPSPASLTISIPVLPREVTVTADDKEMIVRGDEPELTATVSGAVKGEENLIQYKLSREAGDGVGKYAITPAGASDQGNYRVTYQNGTLVIRDCTTYTARILWEDTYQNKEDYDQMRPPEVWLTFAGDPDISASAAGGWTVTRTMPAFDDEGNPVDYSGLEWEQEEIPGYETSSTVIYDGDEKITIFSNVHRVNPKNVTTQRIKVNWDDNNNEFKRRPSSLTFTLNSGESVTLNEANGWSGEIPDLPVHRDGTRYVYTWDTVSVKDYELSTTELDSIWDSSDGDLVTGEVLILTYRCLLKKETVVPDHYTLTIRYYFRDGSGLTEAREPYVAVLEKGSSYYEKTPEIAGFTASRSEVSGTLNSNTVVNIYYTPITYTLTIRYRYTNGNQAAPYYRARYAAGDAYSVTSPTVSGYRTNTPVVSGVMPAGDRTIDVYYTRRSSGGGTTTPTNTTRTRTTAAASTETVIEEYPTPLGQGVGAATINAGECFE